MNCAQQLEFEVRYNLRCETAESMFDLRDVVTYLGTRVGLIPGLIWFGAGSAINAKLTATQRRNFLRFLDRHELRRFLVLDDFHKKQPASTTRDPYRLADCAVPAYGSMRINAPSFSAVSIYK